MNYYTALQRKTDKKWDYTRRNGDSIHAIGYCSGAARGDEYHEVGHETEGQARECYKQYLLDNELRLEGQELADSRRMCECDGCEVWTGKMAAISPTRSFILCDEHRTREVVSGLFSVGDSMSSY